MSRKVITNPRLAAYLAEHHPGILDDFNAIVLQDTPL